MPVIIIGVLGFILGIIKGDIVMEICGVILFIIGLYSFYFNKLTLEKMYRVILLSKLLKLNGKNQNTNFTTKIARSDMIEKEKINLKIVRGKESYKEDSDSVTDVFVDEGEYKFSLTNELIQEKIIECVKPNKKDTFSYQNLNLTYGVVNEKENFFLTRSYFLSECIKRCGEDDDYEFVVITQQNSFTVSCQFGNRNEVRNMYVRGMTQLNTNTIIGAILFYENYKKRHEFEKVYEKENNGINLYDLNYMYLGKLVK